MPVPTLDSLFAELRPSFNHPEIGTREFSSYEDLRGFLRDELNFLTQFAEEGFTEPVRQMVRALEELPQRNQEFLRLQIPSLVARVGLENIPYRETVLGKFLHECFDESPEIGRAAAGYFAGRSLDRVSPQRFRGYLRATLFAHPGIDKGSRLAYQQAALDDLRNEIVALRDAMRYDKERLQEENKEWNVRCAEQWDVIVSKSGADISGFLQQWSQSLTTLSDSSRKDMEQVRTQYTELMRLKGPAEQWRDFADDYAIKAKYHRKFLLALCVPLFLLAGLVLYVPPAFFAANGLSVGTFRATASLALAFSVLVYLIVLEVRLMTSCIHLHRDARERYQLTVVYLGLLGEGAIEPKQRDIVLPALFSRSDTGLLKHDASPTMPSGLGAIIQELKGK